MSGEAFCGALSYSGDFGKIQIGAPRNALHDYVNAPEMGGLALFDLQLAPFMGSYLPIVGFEDDETPLGLRYDGTFSAASIGASYQDVEGAGVVDLAVNYSLGQTRLMAGIKHVSENGSSATSHFLGAEHDFGQLTAGAILGQAELPGDVQNIQA